MKTQPAWRGLAIALLFAGAALYGRAASFSAEFVDTNGKQTRTGLFNVQDKSYRLETADSGRKLVMTFDGRSGITRVINPAEKAYHEPDVDKGMDRLVNPFACYAFFFRTAEVRTEGTEKIDGHFCTKQIVSSGEQVFVIAWWSEEFGFPLKVEVPILARTVELRNIQSGPQDAALFTLPADYKLISMDTEPPPEWTAKVPGAPLVTPPFEKTLAQEQIIRIHPKAANSIKLEFTGAGAESSGFTAVAFKAGKPLHDPAGNTANVDPEQAANMTFEDTPAQTDEIVVRVRNGAVRVKGTFVGVRGAAAGGNPTAPESSAAAQEATAELNAPQTASVAERIEVSWTGPGNNDDYVSVARPAQAAGAYLARAGVREGNPLRIWTPSEPGEYEVRYIVGRGAKLLAHSPLTVTDVNAAVQLTSPVNVAAQVEVKWEGPGREGDFISLARVDQPPGAFITRTHIRNGNPLQVRAASDPGNYEVRYVLGRGNRVLAKAPLPVNAVTAELNLPATAASGAEISVTWQGPGYAEDFVSVARTNQAPNASLAKAQVRQGNPLKLRLPKEPGTYEVRYVLGFGNKLLAKTSITVAP